MSVTQPHSLISALPMTALLLGLPGGAAIKNPSVMLEMQETWVKSLGQEDTLERGMAIHSSILAWKIPWTEEPGRLQSMGSQRVRHNRATNTFN